jgi:hypothetical protein
MTTIATHDAARTAGAVAPVVNNRRYYMAAKRLVIVLSTVIALGVVGASAAQASDHENQSGGFKIGPLGQRFGPVRGPAFGFAYVPYRHRYGHRHHYEYRYH